MAPHGSTESEAARLYRAVIDDVVGRMRGVFVNMGVDEQVLVDLQALWERRLLETGAVRTRDMPASGLSFAPGGAQAAYPVVVLPQIPAVVRPPEGGGARPKPPAQYDGACDSDDAEAMPLPGTEIVLELDMPLSGGALSDGASAFTALPQYDGAEDADGGAQKLKRDDDELGSDLDSSDDDGPGGTGGVDQPTDDIVLCLYEKVHRVKTRWRGVLRAGVASFGGPPMLRHDYVFGRATVDFEW